MFGFDSKYNISVKENVSWRLLCLVVYFIYKAGGCCSAEESLARESSYLMFCSLLALRTWNASRTDVKTSTGKFRPLTESGALDWNAFDDIKLFPVTDSKYDSGMRK